MSIPYNDALSWNSYQTTPDWYKNQPAAPPSSEAPVKRAANELFAQPVVRGVQFIRDAARLVLKVPIRALKTPIILEKNWKELERAKVNAKLTGYSFVQLVTAIVKIPVALAALATAVISPDKATWLLDQSARFTAYLDGRASQLEALKEEGAKREGNREEYNNYKSWLYGIDPKLCRKP
jgi:hypothetical protein